MSQILNGAGSTILHALTSASAESLGASKIVGHCMSRDNNGSTVVAVTIGTEDRIPLSTIYYGAEGTVAKAITNASLPTTNAGIKDLDLARDSNGSVWILATVSPDVTPVNVYSGTGSTITHALSVANVSALTNPRVGFQKAAIDVVGSVTVMVGIGDERVPN